MPCLARRFVIIKTAIIKADIGRRRFTLRLSILIRLFWLCQPYGESFAGHISVHTLSTAQ